MSEPVFVDEQDALTVSDLIECFDEEWYDAHGQGD